MNDGSVTSRLTPGEGAGVSEAPTTHRRRGRWLQLLVLPSLALVLLAAAGLWLYDQYHHVVVYDARIRSDVITISSRVQGWITELPVNEGDRLRRGDVMLNLDARETNTRIIELNSAIAALRAEQAMIAAQVTMVDLQTNGRLQSSRAALRATQAAHNALASDLELAESEYNRAESLLKNRVISRQRWETLRTGLLTAQQKLAQGEADVARARADIAEAEASRHEIEVQQRRRETLGHEIERLEAQRELLQIALDDRQLTAPLNSIVDRVFVDPGEFVLPGQRLLLLHDPDSIWIEANVKETDIRYLKLGAKAKVSVDAYPDMVLEGEVVRLGQSATSEFALLPSPNPSGNFTKITQRLPVKIAIPQVEGLLRPGMMVEVDIVIDRD